MLDILNLYLDFKIPIAPANDKHYKEGWVETYCPFCNSGKFHLGYNIEHGYFNCWSCGWHGITETLYKLLHLSIDEVKQAVEHYTTAAVYIPKEVIEKAKVCEFPYGTVPLRNKHREYLIGRGFNSQELEQQWDIKGTLGIGDYGNRILIPVKYHNIMCSYQGRDITGKSILRYKACAKQNEVIDHKDLVYGYDQAVPYKQCIVVEGVFDAWKLGPGAVCTFGINFKDKQVYTLAKHFNKVYTCFDNETQAQIQAVKLKSELEFRGVSCQNIRIDVKDPGVMEKRDADKLMVKLGFL